MVLFIPVTLDAAPLQASASPAAHETYELAHNVALDGAITSGAAAFLVGSELIRQLASGPTSCSWCDRTEGGADALNGIDRSARDALRWSHPSAANVASWITVGLVPLASFGVSAAAAHHDGASQRITTDALLVAEATLVAAALNQGVKLIARRARPYAHASSAPLDGPDDNVSFFSQHTTLAFAATAATGTIATLRGYRWAPFAWAIGLPLAVSTGYLRLAADRHYLTDVLTGAVFGTAMGIAIPLLFHGREAALGGTLGTQPLPGGVMLTWGAAL